MPKKTQKTDPKSIKEQIVLKALVLAEEQGWENTTLSDIAGALNLSLAELFDHVDDKEDVLVLFGKMIDRKVLDEIKEPDPSLSARDQLFDILMERFEILNEYRPGVLAILRSFKFDPKQALFSAPHLCRSMTWMAEAAGLETNGIRGAAKVAGLTGVYIKALKTWKEDESPDLAKVMAALDKDLERAERVANTFGF